MAGGITWRATNDYVNKIITQGKAEKYSQPMSENNPHTRNNTTEPNYH